MKLEVLNHEANKVWKNVASHTGNDELLQLEIDLYKKLLVLFQIGDFCYGVFNFHKLDFDFISNEVTSLLGYTPEEINAALILEIVHPDDRAWFLSCQDISGQFLMGLPPNRQMKYKLRFDCRYRKKTGEYIRLMLQVVVIHADDKGGIIRPLLVFTDISSLKQHGKPVLSYIGMEGEPSYLDVDVAGTLLQKSNILSRREKEVLFELTKGKASKEIAAILGISKETVDRHRKNMLHKHNLRNTGELIGKAIRDGWL